MNAIKSVFNAFGNLAASLNALASVVDCATAKLRLQLATETEPAALPHGGEVNDNRAAETETTPTAAKGKNGRKPTSV